MPEKERLPGLIVKSAELETVCGITSKLPETEAPEFAFAGKSNVGKSTLINALMQRKSLARTSATPGKTQTINFYKVNGEFYFVDLPGYGFTKADVSTREKWGKMVERYLLKTKNLKAVFLLVDMRHRPTADDTQMLSWIRHFGLPFAVILTKEDKLKKNEKPKALRLIRETLALTEEDTLIPFSAVSKKGREEIYSYIGLLTGKESGSGLS